MRFAQAFGDHLRGRLQFSDRSLTGSHQHSVMTAAGFVVAVACLAPPLAWADVATAASPDASTTSAAPSGGRPIIHGPTNGSTPIAEVVVVATARLAPAMGQETYSVVTIQGATLERRPRLDQALEQVPGLSLFRRSSSLSANPTVEGVSLRAIAPSGASRALVTLDGVPQADPFGGWVIWSDLPSEAIDTAEIIRGAGAGPYGAGALTGVVALRERTPAPGEWSLDAQGGGLGFSREAAVADLGIGPGNLFVDASGEHSDGWIPIIAGRGAADHPLALNDWQTSARYTADLAGGAFAARVSTFGQDQATGVSDGFARASGTSESLSWARAPSAGALGGELQIWARESDFSQLSLSEAVGHATATPADLQFATPAWGVGANGALRGGGAGWNWEAGFDVRTAHGATHELYAYSGGAFADQRVAGGSDLVAGLYAEGAAHSGPWLVTGGVRLDGWDDWDGFLQQQVRATGKTLTNDRYAARGGAVPTGRVGLRRTVGQASYVRVDAYAGFRPPTLNELYRPYRVGNQSIAANAALQPERLYGAEAGLGREGKIVSLDADVFYNRLDDPVINVTLNPSNPTVLQRENVPEIEAVGVEAQAREKAFGGRVTLTEALAATDAHVRGGVVAPQLNGKWPAQAPYLTATAGLAWQATARVSLDVQARYESRRFDDDLNLHRLNGGTLVAARATWQINPHAALFLASENLFDTRLPTAVNTDGTIGYDAPRLITVGLSLRN